MPYAVYGRKALGNTGTSGLTFSTLCPGFWPPRPACAAGYASQHSPGSNGCWGTGAGRAGRTPGSAAGGPRPGPPHTAPGLPVGRRTGSSGRGQSRSASAGRDRGRPRRPAAGSSHGRSWRTGRGSAAWPGVAGPRSCANMAHY